MICPIHVSPNIVELSSPRLSSIIDSKKMKRTSSKVKIVIAKSMTVLLLFYGDGKGDTIASML
jgi:hypothetical protein